MCASVIAKLQGSGVSNNVILSVVESMEECLNEFHTSFKNQILNVVPECNVENVLANLKNPFSDLNTNSKWKKYFCEQWGVVQPLEVHLGVRYDSRKNRSSDTVLHTVWVRCSGIEYRCGSVVCIDVVDEMPLFCKVVVIILRKEEIHFLLMQMEAVFNEHLHAFQVEDLDHFCIVKQHELQHPKPFDLQMSYDSDSFLYVVTDCCIL